MQLAPDSTGMLYPTSYHRQPIFNQDPSDIVRRTKTLHEALTDSFNVNATKAKASLEETNPSLARARRAMIALSDAKVGGNYKTRLSSLRDIR